ncbi:MAG TPA: AI-2E family transporter [Acholeplasmataceae bacterium]|nr:AI-2E family transporter [Acholeplasmataceae bacterium]
MLNENIKKLIFILLLAVTCYVFFLLLPYLAIIFRYIIKIITPFIIAFALAFILQPIVCFFQNKGLSRGLSVAVVLIIFLATVILTIVLTIPHLVSEVKLLIERVPIILKDIKHILDEFAKLFDFLPEKYRPNYDNVNGFLSKYLSEIGAIPNNLLNKLTRILSTLILVPMILIYFLLDYEKILCSLRNYLIKTNKIRFKNYLADLNKIMGSYFRGVFLVIIILTIAFSIAFFIIDLDFAIFFGLIIGITNIIPYLGSYIGGAFPFIYALAESPQKAFTVLAISVVFQTLESDLLSPYIHSKQIKIHPLIVIFFLLVFGSLFGIIGMMVAVPILSMIKITLKHYPIRIKKKNM